MTPLYRKCVELWELIYRMTGSELVSWDGIGACEKLRSSSELLSDDEADTFAHYCISRHDGSSPKLAEMFAEGRPPQANTDATFLNGHCNGSQFSDFEQYGNSIKKIAEGEGQSVKGKVYLSQLARYPGDPEAWVDGRGDVSRVVRKRGWRCSGAVNENASSEAGKPASKRRKIKIPKPDSESIRRINEGTIRSA